MSYNPPPSTRARRHYVLLMAALLVGVFPLRGQELDPEELKRLSLEALMEIEVTSVSRQPESIMEVPSAVVVISREDIMRSGATSIPEALRLAPNLQVAQLNASQWIISARGFNALFANKLLVMIDGRTVYSPLFAGVFWDVQQLPLEHVERIEVISGPGASVWGSNAVNGVINIITRESSDTDGVYASVGAGSFLRRDVALHYGAGAGTPFSFRVYGMHNARADTETLAGEDANDAWHHSQVGFRLDWDVSEKGALMATGNAYVGEHAHNPTASTSDGQNILARWQHRFSERSGLSVQAYFDRTWRRDVPSTFSDEMTTYDLEVDHHLQIGRRHNLIYGAGYRFMNNLTLNATEVVGFLPKERDMDLLSAFAQDEISLLDDALRLTLGIKVQHHEFSGFEWQPTARVVWVKPAYAWWAATSRAVRAPSRIDVDYRLPPYDVPPHLPSVAGGPDFRSEKLNAYETGLRVTPYPGMALSLSLFYNRYDDLYSVDADPGTLTYEIRNNSEGRTHGVELASWWEVSPSWHLRAGYSYLSTDLSAGPGSPFDVSILGNDAPHRAVLQSVLDLPGNFQWDAVFRYIGDLPQPPVPAYVTFDTRLAWVRRGLEIAVIGQNLGERRHQEFGNLMPRGVFAKVSFRR